jgi:hypothetical protein
MKLRKQRRIKVQASGRQGKTIYDELVETLPLPTNFAFPFMWPESVEPQQETPAGKWSWAWGYGGPAKIFPSKDSGSDELVAFWAKQREEYLATHSKKQVAKDLRKLSRALEGG